MAFGEGLGFLHFVGLIRISHFMNWITKGNIRIKTAICEYSPTFRKIVELLRKSVAHRIPWIVRKGKTYNL